MREKKCKKNIKKINMQTRTSKTKNRKLKEPEK